MPKLNRFQLKFVRCENVKHGITSELHYQCIILFEHLQLDLIRGNEISSKFSEALRLGALLTGALMTV